MGEDKEYTMVRGHTMVTVIQHWFLIILCCKVEAVDGVLNKYEMYGVITCNTICSRDSMESGLGSIGITIF